MILIYLRGAQYYRQHYQGFIYAVNKIIMQKLKVFKL